MDAGKNIDLWLLSETNVETEMPSILAKYTSFSADELVIKRKGYGKPELVHDEFHVKVHFNLSHSDGIGLLAVSNMPLGVDIEKRREISALETCIEYICTEEEARIVNRLSGDKKRALFFEVWVRKEACVKALGMDILASCAQFPVIAEEEAVIDGWVFLDMFWQDTQAWYIKVPKGLDRFIEGYSAACCTPNEEVTVRVFHYKDEADT